MASALGVGANKVETVGKAMAEAASPLVQPLFTVVFDDGNGDFVDLPRLVPANPDVKRSCLDAKDPFISTMRKLLDEYPTLLAEVRKKVIGGMQ